MTIITFNKSYFLLFLVILLAEILIALYLKSGFIRHTFGDYLVVILIYCFVKSFIKNHCKTVAVSVLVFAYVVETLQAFNLLKLLNLQHSTLAQLILGSTFSISDLIAYTFGFFTIILVEYQRAKTSN